MRYIYDQKYAMPFRYFAIVPFLVISAFVVKGQGLYTETDMASQKLLIAAKKEALLGKEEKAEELYLQLLKEHAEMSAAYELSKIYLKKEDPLQAQSYAKMAYDHDPKNEWFMVQYADVLALNENHDKTAEIYEAYTSIQPKNDYHYLQASYHFLKAEKPKEAIKMLDKLEENIGVSESTIQRKFEIYDVIGKEKEALKELQKLSDKYPTDTRYLNNIAGYLRTIGKDNEANKIMKKILKIDPNDETALLFANSSGKNKDANYLRSLVPIIKDPRIDLDKKILEIIPYLQEFVEEGNAELGQSLLEINSIMDENYPNNAKVKSILGDINFYKENLDVAIQNYKASVEIDKSVWTVWSQLLLALNIKGDYVLMEEMSEEAIDVYPNQSMAYYYNGLALLENGNLVESEMSIREAGMIGSRNEGLQKEVNLVLSRIKFQSKDYSSALDYLENSLTETEKANPRFLEHLGDIKYAMKDQSAAKDAWKQALKAGGNEERLSKKISGEINPN